MTIRDCVLCHTALGNFRAHYGVCEELGTGITLGLGTGPLCGSVMTGLVGVYGGGVTGA